MVRNLAMVCLLTLAGLLPDSACATPPCVPAEGSKLPKAFEQYVQDGHAVTPSGGIYFADRGTGQLYLRRDAAGPGATTELVSLTAPSERGRLVGFSDLCASFVAAGLALLGGLVYSGAGVTALALAAAGLAVVPGLWLAARPKPAVA